jgi:hypothetical protein
MIHATDMLNERIRSIMCYRKGKGMDPTPTLADIEKTHLLFVNAHYKPFAAIAYEYTKVRAMSGSISWGGHIQFSIPAYGEFFSDMVAHVGLGSVQCSASVVPAFPAAITAVDVVTNATSQVSGTENAVAGIYTLYTQQYVNAAGTVLSVGAAATNFTRYAEYPGERLFREVKFEISGNPLDTYTSDATLFYRKFFVTHDKEVGWKRLVGQEVPVDAYSNETAISGTNAFVAPMANLVDVGGIQVGTADATITARKLVQVVSGPQTPKAVQPALDLWIPLLFWFNKDVRLAIPSVSIPFGQRFITIDLNDQANIVFPAPGNLFLRLTTETRTDGGGVGTGTAVAQGVVTVARQVNYEPILLSGSTVTPSQTLTAELYVNNLFVNPEIHDIYIKRIGFTLVRVHRLQNPEVTSSSEDRLLSQLKWPTEMIFVGMRPTYNTSALNPNQYRDWHNLTAITDETMYGVSRSSGAAQTVATAGAVAWPTDVKSFTHRETSEQIYVPVYTQTIDSLKVTVQGNEIITQTEAPFFRDYTPWYYGQTVMRTPVDLGALLINFCIYPGHYQPSGHINISRAREFYVHYDSSYCSTSAPCQFITLGIAINFLLVTDGSAVLRFTS